MHRATAFGGSGRAPQIKEDSRQHSGQVTCLASVRKQGRTSRKHFSTYSTERLGNAGLAEQAACACQRGSQCCNAKQAGEYDCMSKKEHKKRQRRLRLPTAKALRLQISAMLGCGLKTATHLLRPIQHDPFPSSQEQMTTQDCQFAARSHSGLFLAVNFGHVLAEKSPAGQIWRLLKGILAFLIRPVGGDPVAVAEGLPGLRTKVTRGHRRWLGLRPGRVQPIPDAGPWWTPSGFLHLLKCIPNGVWLLAILLLARAAFVVLTRRRRDRDKLIQRQTLITAAKSTDLKVQKNRMMRALGASVQADVPGVEIEPAAEHQWQDPSEWDEATRQQWDDFMRKSRAFKLRRDQWWEITSGDDTPYTKLAADRLSKEGKLPDYGPDTMA